MPAGPLSVELARAGLEFELGGAHLLQITEATAGRVVFRDMALASDCGPAMWPVAPHVWRAAPQQGNAARDLGAGQHSAHMRSVLSGRAGALIVVRRSWCASGLSDVSAVVTAFIAHMVCVQGALFFSARRLQLLSTIRFVLASGVLAHRSSPAC